MVRLSQYASNQIQSIVNQYCGYKTRGENGRSAFWFWYDQVKNLIRGITVGSSTRLSNGVYKYTMRYWGDVFFVYSRTREKGRFSGIVITVLDFDFDETNFYNWLQHKPLENHLPPKPNIINPQFKPRPLGFGYTMVKAKSGLYTIADSNGQPLNSNEWFKSILKMRKTVKGEIATFVNKNGFAYAYYPQREKHLMATNMSWSRVCTNESKETKLTLTESDLRIMVKECVSRIMTEYKDNPIFGWTHIEKTRREAGASDEQIELLHQSYDEFGKEKASKGEIPNDAGFEIWCSKKDAESCRNGKGMRFPDYRG